MPTETVDPITTEILRNAFSAIAAEMNANLSRSAFSPVIYEMKDCSVAIFDDKAELLGQSPGLPIFLGALDEALKSTIDHVGIENFEPGDVYVLNDPYITGSHLNDVTVESPVFYGDRLVGFTSSKAHWRDVGGKQAGLITDTTEIYQEGLRLGPTRLVAAGKMQHDILDILARNSRAPVALIGDLNAQIACARTGERRLAALIERFGLKTVRQATQQIFRQTEKLERASVAALPDGQYQAEGFLDNDGMGKQPVYVQVRVVIDGDSMLIDLSGSNPQSPGCVNCGLPQTLSAARLAFKFLVLPHAQPNGGSFRSLQVQVPSGSIFAAQEPAACLYYFPHLGLMMDLVLRALAPAVPDKVIAGQTGDPMNVFLAGHHPGDGRLFMSGESTAMGWGASSWQDGLNAVVNYGGGDLKNLPVEVLESKYPIRIARHALNVDSGGAGRQRGGLGIIKDYVSLTEGITVSLWFERSLMPGWGLFGGGDGKPPVVVLNPGTPNERQVWKVNHLHLTPGTYISARTGGGGGYGLPWERPVAKVMDDLADGYISREEAEKAYGVCFIDRTMAPDEAATQAARAALADEY
jgi:N-methylhydantoinase B